MKNAYRGVCAALLTPFDESNRINHKALAGQVKRLIAQGIDGFYVCGSTAEAFLLTEDERKAVLDTVCAANNGQKLVIAHVGQIATEAAIALGKHARAAGADAVSSISPFYYKFTNEEIIAYYSELMTAADMPFFIYNFPAFSGFSLTPEILDKLCENPRVAGVKFTASDFYQLERMKRAHPELCVWNGFDEMLLAGLSAGADGGIGSTYNVLCPVIRLVYEAFRAGDIAKAQRCQHIANDMIAVICKYGVFASIKLLLGMEGLDFGACRKPFRMPGAQAAGELRAAFEQYKARLEAEQA